MDLLDHLGSSRFCTTLDLASGFWQVKTDDESWEKTAFITHHGLFEFHVMPFGLTNAPGIFQRLMQRALEGVKPEDGQNFADVYIDDVLVFSQTTEGHVEHLCAVLGRVDIMELPLTNCGNRYAIIVQDFWTKWPFIFTAPDQKLTRLPS